MTKRKNKEVITAKKQMLLIERTAHIFNVSQAEAQNLLSQSLRPFVRINPLADNPKKTLKAMEALGWKGMLSKWCAYGYSIEQGFEALRDSDLVIKGVIYLQNEASWTPVIGLNPQPGETVLDMCAAPGGKTSHIAALMQNKGKLIANDNSRPRLLKLQQNLARLHVKADYSLHDATRLSKSFPEASFDKILLDAPCSGEGLVNLTLPKTLDTWSVAHIRRLSSLQKQLITEAWKLLKPGGRLVYSTCTMAPEENEVVVNHLLKRNEDAHIVPLEMQYDVVHSGITSWNDRDFHPTITHALRLLPARGREAFFVCLLQKAE